MELKRDKNIILVSLGCPASSISFSQSDLDVWCAYRDLAGLSCFYKNKYFLAEGHNLLGL